MANVRLPQIGVLDPGSLEEYYEAEMDFGNSSIQLDLNFAHKTIEGERLEIVRHFIENIRIHDLKNKKYIENDFRDAGADTVKAYLEHHIEELPTDDLEQLIGPGKKAADQPSLLLKKLHLVRVGLYPDSEDSFATFDYSLGTELTNYLVVVNTDENGNLDYLSMES